MVITQHPTVRNRRITALQTDGVSSGYECPCNKHLSAGDPEGLERLCHAGTCDGERTAREQHCGLIVDLLACRDIQAATPDQNRGAGELHS